VPKSFDDLFPENACAPIYSVSRPLSRAGTGAEPEGLPTPPTDFPVASTAPPPSLPLAPPEVTAEDLLAQPFAYLSGPAGTGKTFLARKIVELEADRSILTATTGIAAVNLGDATTINSLLSFFDTKSLMEHYASGFLAYKLRMLRKSGYRRIVLDEISMMEADQLDILCTCLDEINLAKAYDEDLGQVTLEARDSGILQLLLVGDFAQLPPVDGAFAFEAGAWSRFAEHTFKLTTIRRQGDPSYIQALQAVRRGHAGEALPVLRPTFVEKLDLDFPGTTIVPKNDAVDRVNNLRYMRLKGKEFTWLTTRSGQQQKDWLRLIPEVLKLKEGALVMILANKAYPQLDTGDRRVFEYVNGDLATVLGPDQASGGVKVYLHRTLQDVVVTPAVKEWREPTGKRKPPYTVKGVVTYLPLRLAYATTVHKSQGLSLDQVQVAITDGFMSKPSMLYVALSRCRSLEGLRVIGTEKIFLGRCGVEDKVKGWL